MQDTQYFSDSEHHLISGGLASQQRQEMRRLRNRTLTGLETMRLVEQLRPGSATGIRPITPSFNNDKDMLMAQQFIDFNPAGKISNNINTAQWLAQLIPYPPTLGSSLDFT